MVSTIVVSRLGRFAVITLAWCMVLTCNGCRSAEILPESPSGANAAVWYEKASSSFKEPADQKLRAEIRSVVSTGWNGEHPILAGYLRSNEGAILAFKRGAELPACDFLKGQPPPRPDGGLRYPKDLTFLADAVLLEGRKYEKEGKENLALKNYLLVLHMAHHLGQERHVTLLGKAWEIYCQGAAYEPLKQLIQRASFKAETLRKTLEDLSKLKSQQVGLEPAFDAERKFLYSVLAVPIGVEIKKRGAEGAPYAKRAGGLLSAIDRLQEEYAGYLHEAYRRNEPEIFDQKLNGLVQEVKELRSFPAQLNLAVQMALVALADRQKAEDFKNEMMVKILLSSGTPEYGKLITRFYVGRARMNVLIGAIALRLYKIERGSAPKKLDQLVPSYLQQLPEDPFGQFSSLKYVIEKNQWRLYSLGPDRQDQNGTQVLPLGAELENPGDIVFVYPIELK